MYIVQSLCEDSRDLNFFEVDVSVASVYRLSSLSSLHYVFHAVSFIKQSVTPSDNVKSLHKVSVMEK
jgi:hypothetical protein